MLAHALDQLNQVQGEISLKKVLKAPRRCIRGEMLNHVLRICLMAAGITQVERCGHIIQGKIFDIMEYKRFSERKREYPQFQIAKALFSH